MRIPRIKSKIKIIYSQYSNKNSQHSDYFYIFLFYFISKNLSIVNFFSLLSFPFNNFLGYVCRHFFVMVKFHCKVASLFRNPRFLTLGFASLFSDTGRKSVLPDPLFDLQWNFFSLLSFPFNNFLGYVCRHFFVMVKFHCKGSAAFCQGTQTGSITKHFSQRHFG